MSQFGHFRKSKWTILKHRFQWRVRVLYTLVCTHVCVHTYTRTWAQKPILTADSKPLSAALSPVTEVIALMGNAKLSSEVISLEISRNGLLELFFFFKMKSLFSLKNLLQKKQLSPYVFLERGKEGTECASWTLTKYCRPGFHWWLATRIPEMAWPACQVEGYLEESWADLVPQVCWSV